MIKRNSFRVDLRDMEFLLWEQMRLQDGILGRIPFLDFDQELVQGMLRQARDFACQELGMLYQLSDREGCALRADGSVRLPTGYVELWKLYTEVGWGKIGAPPEFGGLGTPYLALQPIQEMFYGSNPAFMTYSGFCTPLLYLIVKYGDAALQQRFCSKLAGNEWSACLCMTEPLAGSDVGSIATRAKRQDDGTYLIQGGKIFISAGFHDLSQNTVYTVLARVEGAPLGTVGLSCFLVPKYRILPDGKVGEDNHVRCVRLEEKMGLHGCATAQLTFGESGPCQGYLLGSRENVGLKQLSTMMSQARIATGIFALGMASSAYLNAAEYAAQRIQGTDFRQSFNARAPKVTIVNHHDVRRMLLEMKSKVESCRALIYKLAFYFTKAIMLRAVPSEANEAEAQEYEGLVSLLTPIVKTYTSDQAWRVAELAIQVHGGYGYTKDFPVEQYARDIKILSIWEGTSFVQAADLIRDKLGLGKSSTLLKLFVEEVTRFIEHSREAAEHEAQVAQLRDALGTLVASHQHIGCQVQEKKIELVFGNATRFLEMMAHVALAWLLLEASIIASRRLTALDSADPDVPFYRGKVLSARFFFGNVLPLVANSATVLRAEDDSVLHADRSVFLDRAAAYG